MRIAHVNKDALKISWPPIRESVTTSGEFAPVEAQVHDKQRGKSEGDDADSG